MVRDYIENFKFYDGVREEFSMSASQFGRDILELYYAQTETPKTRTFGRGEIGSIFHLGMEDMFKKHVNVKDGEWVQEKRFSKKFGLWNINGKMDMIDFMNHIIYDWKGMSASKYAKFKTNKKTAKINIQMAIYNWLLGGGFTAQAHCFITDWDPVNPAHPASAYQIVKCDIMSIEETEIFMREKLDELEGYLAAKKIPPVCDDVMPRYVKTSGAYINSMCEYYCEFAHVCKRKRDDSAKRLGLDWSR